MKTTTMIGGLAALCLLCVLPRLGALTITHSHVTAINGSSLGGGHTITPYWFCTPFDPSMGVLERVSFQTTITVLVSGTDVNHYAPWPSGPKDITPYVYAGLSIDVTDFSSGTAWNSTKSVGQTVTVAPSARISYSANLTTTAMITSTASEDLARFSGAGLWDSGETPHFAYVLATFSGTSFYGGLNSQGNITSTLTYEYRVPDEGQTYVLLLAALGAIGFFRGRHHGMFSVPTLS